MKRKKINKIMIMNILIVLCFLFIFMVWQNYSIVITRYEIENSKIPIEFNGFSILQVSDLHNQKFGKNQSRLIEYTKDINPDIIVITGDFIDRFNPNFEDSIDYVNGAKEIAPIYYVTGNHENKLEIFQEFMDELRKNGVIVLENNRVSLNKSGKSINLIGMIDFSFFDSDYEEYQNTIEENTIKDLYNIVLSHRPELFDRYVKSGVDLVLTGHAHGGQIRLPFIGGLIAPNQGIFPKYTSGIHEKESTSMIVSRGLGNSIIPLRVFNRPELVVIEL